MASDDDESADAILHVFHSIRTLIFIGLSITIIILKMTLNQMKQINIQNFLINII